MFGDLNSRQIEEMLRAQEQIYDQIRRSSTVKCACCGTTQALAPRQSYCGSPLQ